MRVEFALTVLLLASPISWKKYIQTVMNLLYHQVLLNCQMSHQNDLRRRDKYIIEAWESMWPKPPWTCLGLLKYSFRESYQENDLAFCFLDTVHIPGEIFKSFWMMFLNKKVLLQMSLRVEIKGAQRLFLLISNRQMTLKYFPGNPHSNITQFGHNLSFYYTGLPD